MKNKTLKIFLLVFLSLFLLFVFYRVNPFFRLVKINGEIFLAELASSPESQKKGLGGRESLCKKCAMLFDFKEKGRRSFWMKGMEFDLDIIWIRGKKIVFIEKNFSHDSKKTVSPEEEAEKVLEIGAGLSDKFGFEAGDEVTIY